MEHSDFSKILQTFLPIVIFILWAMFSNAGKKRKMRNFPERKSAEPDYAIRGRPKKKKRHIIRRRKGNRKSC